MHQLPISRTIYERAILFDTSALEAIVDPRDQYHHDADQVLVELKNHSFPFYVTTFTIAETHRRLLYKRYIGNPKAQEFLEDVYTGFANIIRPTEEDEKQARRYIKQFQDQELTFTDTISMAVMKSMGLKKIFSFDWHFTLIGLEVIPLFV